MVDRLEAIQEQSIGFINREVVSKEGQFHYDGKKSSLHRR
jgi:hypothetical protein